VLYLLLIVAPLVLVLCVLISRMNHAEQFAPQAYYRRKRGGAPVAGGYEQLGPRIRKPASSQDRAVAPGEPGHHETR
jgi:hypothetical protein